MTTVPTAAEEGGQRDQGMGFVRGFFAGVGDPIVFAYRQFRDIFRVFWLVLYYTLRAPIRWREVIYQFFQIGNRSVLFICTVLGFLGMILIFQSGVQAQNIVGDLSSLGALFLQLLIREFGPTITGLMIATRAGTGIAAEIGSMVVTEQVDALRMNGAQPVQYLIVPRFIACAFATMLLCILGCFVSFFAGMLTAHVYFDLNPQTFMTTRLVGFEDLIVGGAKIFSYGLAIPIVSGQAGLSAFGGSEGVGWATTQAVVNCSLAVVFLDFLISGISFAVFGA